MVLADNLFAQFNAETFSVDDTRNHSAKPFFLDIIKSDVSTIFTAKRIFSSMCTKRVALR